MKTSRFALAILYFMTYMLVSLPTAQAMPSEDYARAAGCYVRQQTEAKQDAQKEIYMLELAFAAGLQTIQAHSAAGTLTKQDKEILQIFTETVPALFNRIRYHSLEIEDEFLQISEMLARKIIANQNLYPAPKNWQKATAFAAVFALADAQENNRINERVKQILAKEGREILSETLFRREIF